MYYLNIVLSIFFILFLPGYIVSYIFFSPRKIDLIERTALSFALSISIVPLFAFYMNLVGIPVTKSTISLQLVFIITTAIITLLVKSWLNKNDKK